MSGENIKGKSKDLIDAIEMDDVEESVDAAYGGQPLSKRVTADCSPLSFYLPEELAKGYTESGWSAWRRTMILAAIAEKYEEDPRAALAAIDLLEKYNWSCVKASGLVADLTVKRTSDDGMTIEDIKVMRMGGVEPPQEAKIIEQEVEDEQPKLEEPKPEEPRPKSAKGKPRDKAHKPPESAYSGGLFGDD